MGTQNLSICFAGKTGQLKSRHGRHSWPIQSGSPSRNRQPQSSVTWLMMCRIDRSICFPTLPPRLVFREKEVVWSPIKKKGPISGATFSKEAIGKESGKAIQANPPVGLARREMSRTESEGHSSAAASFIDISIKHLLRQRKCAGEHLRVKLQVVEKYWVGLRPAVAWGCRGIIFEGWDCRFLHIDCRAFSK
jgi:hypothetical protein